MSSNWAGICKAANGGKHDGVNINEVARSMAATHVQTPRSADTKKIITTAKSKTVAAVKGKGMAATRKQNSSSKKAIDAVQDKIIAAVKGKSKSGKANEPRQNPLYVLPFALRLRILNYVVEPISRPVCLKNRQTGKLGNIPIPAIARAFDQKTYNETMIVLLEQSTLEIHSYEALMKTTGFLQGLVFNEVHNDTSYTLGFEAVRHLTFPYFSRFPHATLERKINSDIILMRSCKNIKSVDLTWVFEELVNVDRFYSGYNGKPVDQLREEYRLHMMLGLQSLKFLHLRWSEGRRSHLSEASADLAYSQVCALKAWFVEEFAERGQKVEVTAS